MEHHRICFLIPWREFPSDATFPYRCISRSGPTAWPSRSPDITAVEVLFWGYVKYIAYSTPVPDINTQNIQIRNAILKISG